MSNNLTLRFSDLYLTNNSTIIKPMESLRVVKGRGAQINPTGRFEHLVRDAIITGQEGPFPKTKFLHSRAKSVVNKVTSPDVPGDYSLNPYQGCEHGCTYCYARTTHAYWGFGSGLDFESKIVIKDNAADLLREKLMSPTWKVSPIMLSGNTDCYQPIEKKLEITRSILEVLWEFRHPVTIVTKNALILRDLDILREMARHNLVKVAISLNTLDDRLRQKLEPRASSVFTRLRTIKHLSNEGIPVTVLAAPIIPGLNDHEIMPLVRTVASHGAVDINHIVIRLNGEVEDIFRDWLQKTYPHKYDKVMNQIASLHEGNVGSSKFGDRMKGSGSFAEAITEQMRLAKKVYFDEIKKIELDTELYQSIKSPQLSLFG